MAEAMYSSRVTDHFDRPRNVGRLAPASDVIEAEAGSAAQNSRFHLSARIAGNVLRELRFEAWGCPHCIAAGSWLTERLSGARLVDLKDWRWREAADTLEVPAEKRGHLLLLEDAVRRLAEVWQQHSYHAS